MLDVWGRLIKLQIYSTMFWCFTEKDVKLIKYDSEQINPYYKVNCGVIGQSHWTSPCRALRPLTDSVMSGEHDDGRTDGRTTACVCNPAGSCGRRGWLYFLKWRETGRLRRGWALFFPPAAFRLQPAEHTMEHMASASVPRKKINK